MIFLTSPVEGKVKEIQIDCFADKSVTVIFGRWINSSDGSRRVTWRDQPETREIGLNPGELRERRLCGGADEKYVWWNLEALVLLDFE